MYIMHIAQYCANKQLNYENVYDLMDLKMCSFTEKNGIVTHEMDPLAYVNS